jgi:hypothetical protein
VLYGILRDIWLLDEGVVTGAARAVLGGSPWRSSATATARRARLHAAVILTPLRIIINSITDDPYKIPLHTAMHCAASEWL